MKIWRAPSGMKVGGGYGSNESDVIAAFHVDMFEMDWRDVFSDCGIRPHLRAFLGMWYVHNLKKKPLSN